MEANLSGQKIVVIQSLAEIQFSRLLPGISEQPFTWTELLVPLNTSTGIWNLYMITNYFVVSLNYDFPVLFPGQQRFHMLSPKPVIEINVASLVAITDLCIWGGNSSLKGLTQLVI